MREQVAIRSKKETYQRTRITITKKELEIDLTKEREIEKELKNIMEKKGKYIHEIYTKIFYKLKQNKKEKEEIANDIFGDSIEKLLQAISSKKYNGEKGDIQKYFYQILINKGIDYLRKENKIYIESFEQAERGRTKNEDYTNLYKNKREKFENEEHKIKKIIKNPEEIIIQKVINMLEKEIIQNIEKFFLKSKKKELFNALKRQYFEQEKIKEIANTYNISTNQCKGWIFRIKQEIRKQETREKAYNTIYNNN